VPDITTHNRKTPNPNCTLSTDHSRTNSNITTWHHDHRKEYHNPQIL